jgi:hypothetical protein
MDRRPALPSPFTSPAASMLPRPSSARSLRSTMHRDGGSAVTLVVRLVGMLPVPSTMYLCREGEKKEKIKIIMLYGVVADGTYTVPDILTREK